MTFVPRQNLKAVNMGGGMATVEDFWLGAVGIGSGEPSGMVCSVFSLA